VPCYVEIDSISLATDYFTQGTNSHRIRDAWVYVDDQLIGVYEMPVKFPVITSGGTHNIKVYPGILNNGIGSDRANYPFFDFYSGSFFLEEGKVTKLSPSVTYYSSTVFEWMEDFEGSGMSLEKLAASDTIVEKTNDPENVFEGTATGAIFLNEGDSIFVGKSSQTFLLPRGSEPVYLEINYKTNTTIQISTLSSDNEEKTAVYIRPSIEDDTLIWKKMYVRLDDVIGNDLSTVKHAILFRIVRDGNIGNCETYIDNIKLVTR
jgi:hypothetical protein